MTMLKPWANSTLMNKVMAKQNLTQPQITFLKKKAANARSLQTREIMALHLRGRDEDSQLSSPSFGKRR
jgi:hypothetical protein